MGIESVEAFRSGFNPVPFNEFVDSDSECCPPKQACRKYQMTVDPFSQRFFIGSLQKAAWP